MFRDFRTRVILRVIFLGLTISLLTFMFSKPNMIFAALLTCIILIVQFIDIFRFISQTNRKLTRFLESIRYSDFISSFQADNKLGQSFKQLNVAFNDVLEAFRKARSEKEEHWQYLNTVVQQVRTGILSFGPEGDIQLVNANARKILGIQALDNIRDLKKINKQLFDAIWDVEAGKSILYKANNEMSLTIQATEIRIQGESIKLVTLQNIQTELQKQELDSWQNLTRVLRHEIMNSITPISSLTSTLKGVLEHELIQEHDHYILKADGAEDLREGLETIENRSKGLITFIDAYREYTSLPLPKIKTVRLHSMLEKVSQLMKPEFKKRVINYSSTCSSEYLTIQADDELLEMVLINLLKNAMEAVSEEKNPTIEMHGHYDESGVKIEVMDNGPGIIPEALTNIFVPFYSTKKQGSGIGLSLSRQIMQMHNGTLTVESVPGVKTKFILRF